MLSMLMTQLAHKACLVQLVACERHVAHAALAWPKRSLEQTVCGVNVSNAFGADLSLAITSPVKIIEDHPHSASPGFYRERFPATT